MRVLFSQQKSKLGDVEGNTKKIIACLDQARILGVGLVVYPELFLSGYPPEDLLFRPEMPNKINAASQRIAENTDDIALIVGAPWYRNKKSYNSALFFNNGHLIHVYHKQVLPNYSVFDEHRYFASGSREVIIDVSGFLFMMSICEEIWIENMEERILGSRVDMVISINASPFYIGKRQERIDMISQLGKRTQTPISYLNSSSCQDELVFDGGSFVVDDGGFMVAGAREFAEDALIYDLIKTRSGLSIRSNRRACALTEEERLFLALTTSLRAYVDNNEFDGVIVGLSGGIDSAVVLVLACAAIGAHRVKAVMLPYKYTSSISIKCARQLAENCAVDYQEIPINRAVDSFIDIMPCDKSSDKWQLTLQNIQARSRGLILMALSNYSGFMVLATGNKSEIAVGYATLYGDMVGGFAPLKDLDKTRVYSLARYCNRSFERIPNDIITRAPSAELLPNQKDSDNLPEYFVLDQILAGYIERRDSADQLRTFADSKLVLEVMQLVDRNEHKRQQATIGTKVTKLAFGKDRRIPITQFWRHDL